MSEQDLATTDVDPSEADLYLDDEEEETDDSTKEKSDPVSRQAEESSEEAEETSEEPSEGDEDDPDVSGLLDQIPEEHREVAKQYAQGRVSGLQRTLTPKLEEAARLRERAAIPDQFEKNLQANPRAVLDSMRRYAKEQGWLKDEQETQDQAPQPPGEMPDPVEDPKAWKDWYEQTRAYDQHLVDQRIAKEREAFMPAQELVREAELRKVRQATQKLIEADDDEMAQLDALSATIQKDPRAAPKALLELVRLRKQVAADKKTTRRTAEEAARGTEERAGLPRTGARKSPPKETGDLLQDVRRELEHEEVPFAD